MQGEPTPHLPDVEGRFPETGEHSLGTFDDVGKCTPRAIIPVGFNRDQSFSDLLNVL
jgi:hypothetical protein